MSKEWQNGQKCQNGQKWQKWQNMTKTDKKWLKVTESDKKWQKVTKSDKNWQKVTKSDKCPISFCVSHLFMSDRISNYLHASGLAILVFKCAKCNKYCSKIIPYSSKHRMSNDYIQTVPSSALSVHCPVLGKIVLVWSPDLTLVATIGSDPLLAKVKPSNL